MPAAVAGGPPVTGLNCGRQDFCSDCTTRRVLMVWLYSCALLGQPTSDQA